jgi:hypothetical protein
VDFRKGKAGKLGKSKQVKLFMERVGKECKNTGERIMSYEQLYAISKQLNLGIERFDHFLDTLNQQNYLILKGNRNYQITTA